MGGPESPSRWSLPVLGQGATGGCASRRRTSYNCRHGPSAVPTSESSQQTGMRLSTLLLVATCHWGGFIHPIRAHPSVLSVAVHSEGGSVLSDVVHHAGLPWNCPLKNKTINRVFARPFDVPNS